MAKSVRQELKEQKDTIKQLFLSGWKVPEIANKFGVNNVAMYEVMRWMGFSFKKTAIDESNLVYADNSVKLEKVVVDGKHYIDVTPIYSPR